MIQICKAKFIFIMNLRETKTYDIHFKYFNIEKKYHTEKRNSKSSKTFKNGKMVKQTIHTLDQHNYLVLLSGNLISIDSQDLYG